MVRSKLEKTLILLCGTIIHSTLSMCEQTWIDGRKFFDAKEDKAMNEQIQQQRAVLIQKYYTIKWATIAAVNLHEATVHEEKGCHEVTYK